MILNLDDDNLKNTDVIATFKPTLLFHCGPRHARISRSPQRCDLKVKLNLNTLRGHHAASPYPDFHDTFDL